MSDPASVAKSARESLSKGLQALQTDPSVPPQLRQLAEPIASAMGGLIQIERSNGTQLMPHAQLALEATRGALSQLQVHQAAHPAVGIAMEAVASSLAMVHALGKLAGIIPGAPQAQQAPQAQAPHAPPPQAYAPPPQPAPQAFAPQAHAAPQQAFAPPAQPAFAAPAPQFAADPFASAPTAVGQPPAPAPGGGGQLFNADLGAHSPTNFYKGLSGNDVVDHGGVFVSTYMIPKIGTPVRLKVSLPGGYEFEAEAIVRWARESSHDNDAPPGFGAQFTRIAQESRQLIYRYVRNREPLFHDDL